MPAHILKNSFQFIDSNGNPVSGGTVEFYEPNGSSTPKAVYSDKTLTTSAGTSATLNALGMFSTELFGSGDYYMVVKYADASTAYDMEYIEGEGSGNNAATEWVESVTPTYIGATSFSVPGDLTSDFHVNRRIKTENTGGTVYSTIVSSVFSSVTTVTVVNDSGTLDSGLSSVELGFLRADNQSFPASKEGLIDSNGNKVLIPAATASAVNEITVTNAATGNGPTIAASGDDSNIDLNLDTKGSGTIKKNATALQKLVLEDTPVQILSSTSTVGSWTTLASGAPAGATAVVLKCYADVYDFLATQTGLNYARLYLRSKASSSAADTSTMAASITADYVTGPGNSSPFLELNTVPINLDSNGDLEYQTIVSVQSNWTGVCGVYRVGYYIDV